MFLQLFPVAWIFPRSLGVICYENEFLVRVTKITSRIVVSWTLRLPFCFCTVFNSVNYGHINRMYSHCYLKCCPSSFSSVYVSIRHAVIIDYLLYFHLLYCTYKWGSKQVNWGTNSFLPAPFEVQKKKKYLSVTSCACARIIHYISSFLVKIRHLVSSSSTC